MLSLLRDLATWALTLWQSWRYGYDRATLDQMRRKRKQQQRADEIRARIHRRGVGRARERLRKYADR